MCTCHRFGREARSLPNAHRTFELQIAHRESLRVIVMSCACLPEVLSKDIRLTGLNFEKKKMLS